MLIAILTIGGAATVITLAALYGRKKQEPAPAAPPTSGTEDDKAKRKPLDDEDESAEGGGADLNKLIDSGKKLAAVIGTYLDKQTEPEEPEKPGPVDPGPPAGPDPLHPSPVPRPSDYYQVVKGDTLWDMSRAAYGLGSHYAVIVSAPENDWMGAGGHDWKGGLYARYSGWNTLFKSGNQYPVVYIPELP